jgi:hypothetical protein
MASLRARAKGQIIVAAPKVNRPGAGAADHLPRPEASEKTFFRTIWRKPSRAANRGYRRWPF